MKKIIFLLMFLPFVAVSEQRECNLGVVIPLTGPVAYIGNYAQKGIEIATSVLEKQNPGVKFQIHLEDGKWDAKVGLDAYRSLHSKFKLDGVMTGVSQVSLAIRDQAERDGVFQVAGFTSTPKYLKEETTSFRVAPGFSADSKAIGSYLQEHQLKNIVIVVVESEFGSGLRDVLTSALKDYGVSINRSESFMPDQMDFKDIISRIKSDPPQAIIIGAAAGQTGQFAKQAHQLGMNVPFLGIRSSFDKSLFETAGDAAEGMIISYAFDVQSKYKNTAEFVELYNKKFGEDPETYAAEGYEAMRFLGESCVKCGNDAQCGRKLLLSRSDLPTVFGPVTFTSTGDVNYPSRAMIVKGRQLVMIPPSVG